MIEIKQILPYKDSVEIVSLGDKQKKKKKEVKIRRQSDASLSYSKNSKMSSHGRIKTCLVLVLISWYTGFP
ncbi:hypothetical protein EPI10_028645 [Gossypium australe]|uniref:Uncharacterized protein n=1 Tax=Gossypium australe TaxID=47621 RepID=A0A5B6UWG8_9ROSI|nr:hypothetical protein EPI10_028645 [Gossypium australe]